MLTAIRANYNFFSSFMNGSCVFVPTRQRFCLVGYIGTQHVLNDYSSTTTCAHLDMIISTPSGVLVRISSPSTLFMMVVSAMSSTRLTICLTCSTAEILVSS